MFIPLLDDVSTWDIQKKIVFIDDWFWINQDTEILRKLDYEILDIDYCDLGISADEIYDFAIVLADSVGEILNEYHKIRYSSLYWRRVLGYYFTRFVPIIAFRYVRLCMLKDKFPNVKFYTNVLEESAGAFVMLDPVDLERDGLKYGMHIYLSLIQNGDFPIRINRLKVPMRNVGLRKEIEIDVEPSIAVSRDSVLKRIFRNIKHPKEAAGKCYYRMWNLFRNYSKDDVKIALAWFGSRKLGEKLKVKTNGAIDWIPEEIVPVWEKRIKSIPEIDFRFREYAQTQLSLKLNDRNGWRKAVANIVFQELPCCFVENYVLCSSVYRHFFQQYPNLKVILSGPGALFSESMFALSEQREKGVKFSFMQHGACTPSKYRRKQIGYMLSDFYYGWGKWGEDVSKSIIDYHHSPADKLYWLYGDGKRKTKGNGILYVGDYVHPVLSGLGYHTLGRLYRQEKQFVEKLEKKNRIELTIRNYPNSYGKVLDDLVRTNFPDIKYSQIDEEGIASQQRFSEALSFSKIVVMDHVETPWLEALYIRKPFIVFFDYDFTEFYFDLETEKVYVDMMKEVGLVQNGPNAAAEYINKIYPNIDEWWSDKRRQEVLEILRERYTEPYVDSGKWWYNEIKKILNHVNDE